MQVESNPVIVTDNEGAKIYNDFENLRGQVNSRLVAVDSRVRDRNFFQNANNFKIHFETGMRGVYSIELLCAIIPIPGAVTEKYAVLSVDQISVMEGAQTTATTGFDTPIFTNAFAALPMINNLVIGGTNAYHWEKDSIRFIKRFKPKLEKLDGLKISLNLVNNATFSSKTPYPFNNENVGAPTSAVDNIFLLFEIVSQS